MHLLLAISAISFLLLGCSSSSRPLSPTARELASTTSCDTPIDLRQAGFSLHGLPAGAQGDGYTCGFYATSGLVDAYRQAYRHQKVSGEGVLPTHSVALAVDLAVESNRPVWLPLQLTSDPLTEVGGRHGSLVCDIVNHVRKFGVCDHKCPVVYDHSGMSKEADRASALYMLLYRFARASRKKLDLDEVLAKIVALVPEGGMPAADLRKLILRNRRKPYRTVREILYPNCAVDRIVRETSVLPKCRTRVFAGLDLVGGAGGERDPLRGRRAGKWLHHLLEKPNALPVIATHCYRVFQEGRAINGSSLLSTKCVLHHVSVIGRRKKEGVWQYLIRNSYDPKDEYAVSPDWERDGDDFWVDADPFERSMYAVQFLDPEALARQSAKGVATPSGLMDNAGPFDEKVGFSESADSKEDAKLVELEQRLLPRFSTDRNP